MNSKKVFILMLAAWVATSRFAAVAYAEESPKGKYAFWDYKLPIEVRVADLVKQMTIEEKISNLAADADAIPRLGIKKFGYGGEALHGVMGGKFTVFPIPIAMGAAWDPDMVHKVATAISDEAWGAINRDDEKEGYPGTRFHSFWAPNINMARDPRWGRTAETYGEDPFLTGRNAVAYVTGIQGDDPKYIKATSAPKHFAANNEDHNRGYCNAKISERAMREYYFPAFRDAVTEGRSQSIMGAYNAINGVPCNANKWLLVDVLRGDWGFNGYVVTDCGAPHLIYAKHKYAKNPAEAAAVVLNAGVAVECGGDDVLRTNSRESMKLGLLTESTIDRAVTEGMTVRFRLGMFDPPEMNPYTKIPPSVIGSPEHVELARQVSRESVVLLKNAPVGKTPLLPLELKNIKTIAVVGRNAAVLQFGDYSGTPVNPAITPLEGIKNKVGTNVEVRSAEWFPAPEDNEYKTIPTGNLSAGAAQGLKAEYYDNADFAGSPVVTRLDAEVALSAANVPPEAAKGAVSVRWTGKLVADKQGVHYLYFEGGGGARAYLDGELVFEKIALKKKKKIKTGGVLDEYYADLKEERKSAVLMLEAGRQYDIVAEYWSPKGATQARLEWVAPNDMNTTARAAEMDAVKNSDVVVAFVGLQLSDEHETFDRHTLDISNDQTEYVKQLLKLNPNVVVVLINGGPVSINWIARNAPAILEAWYPGEQGGNAIADVLFGDYNPAGRLPVTVHKSVDELPPFDDYDVTKGRTYKYFPNEVLYPFGYGLSYSSFEYGGISIDRKSAGAADTINVSFDVKNTGARDGDEVAQLYVHKTESAEIRPIKELRGFKRVFLGKGESKTITLPVAIKDLAFWDDKAKKFVIEPSNYEIYVGASSKDIRLRDTIAVSGE